MNAADHHTRADPRWQDAIRHCGHVGAALSVSTRPKRLDRALRWVFALAMASLAAGAARDFHAPMWATVGVGVLAGAGVALLERR